jgi:hypothetical protein
VFCLLRSFPVSRHKHVLLPLLLGAVLVFGWAAECAAQYPWWGPYPYPRYYVDPGAAVRLDVKPKEAEVYVDGYYAGIVDDFNGTFQRLRLPPGAHEITLYRDEYRTIHQKVFLTPDNTLKLKLVMERLGPGDQPEGRPQPPAPPPGGPGTAPGGSGAPYPYPPPRGPMGRRAPQPPSPPPPPNEPAGATAAASGTLSIRVQPGDADVLIDGERWQGSRGQGPLSIDLPAGRHTIQIQKTGYLTYLTEVEVRRGETTPLNVTLRNQ